MENPVLIFGAKGLGRVALDVFQRNDVLVYGFLDDDTTLHNTEIGDIPVLGSTDDDDFLKLVGKKCEAFVAIEERSLRRNLVDMLQEKRKLQPVNAIHDTALVSALADIGHGNLVGARVAISATATVGHHNILQTGVVIEHGAVVGDFVNLGAGAIIGAEAKLENEVFVGAGAVVVAGVSVGKGASIGAGSVVIENVPKGARMFGNPAQKIGG